MEQRLEQFLEKESARLGIRISSRQPMESRLRQLVRHMSPATTTEDDVTGLVSLLYMQLQKQGDAQPRMTTRSMVKRG